jgi:leukotriene-A4 hydrolase
MKKFLYSSICLSLLTLFSCARIATNSKRTSENSEFTKKDFHTYSNIEEIRTNHVHLELEVNFENKTIYGVARHEMTDNNADTAIFDIKALEIQKVTLGVKEEKATDFVIGKADSLLGQALQVKIKPGTKYINIYYKTTKNTEALDWLSPELTTGKKHPFVYTQGQAILTRSWIPLQDTPANRITYSADVTVPKDLMALLQIQLRKMRKESIILK